MALTTSQTDAVATQAAQQHHLVSALDAQATRTASEATRITAAIAAAADAAFALRSSSPTTEETETKTALIRNGLDLMKAALPDGKSSG